MDKLNFEVEYVRNNVVCNVVISEGLYYWDDVCNDIVTKYNESMPNDLLSFDTIFNVSDLRIIDVPKFFIDYIDNKVNKWNDLFEAYYKELYIYDFEVIEAGIDCEIDLKSISEAYQGEYESDADFASNIYNECYDCSIEPKWLVIDWEESARELMYDFIESNGHYFNLLV